MDACKNVAYIKNKMPLQTSGVLTMSNIKAEFNGTTPIKISDYYQNAAAQYTFGVTGIPNTGSLIKFSDFYGKSSSYTGLFAFTTYTFTNATATGANGPTLAQCRSAYSSTSWGSNNTYFTMNNNSGIQLWTVPASGFYQITAAGAQGGTSANGTTGAKGRIVQATFTVMKSNVLAIIVGQQGVTASGFGGGGGGGASLVRYNGGSALIVAGGGGGAGGNSSIYLPTNATATPAGTGNGGAAPGTNMGGGGGGYNTGGATNVSGGIGGAALTGTAIGGTGTGAGSGGFGGGGGGSSTNGWSGGGGGGYTGGDGPTGYDGGGLGGTSYASQTLTDLGTQSGMGYVTITKTGTLTYPPVGLGALTTTVSGQLYGNGTYVLSASSSLSAFAMDPWKAFNKGTSGAQECWSSDSTGYVQATGLYSGAYTTTVSGTSYAGQWIQIQLPSAISIASYTIWPYSGVIGRSPYTWYLAGSTNGSTWSLVDSRTGISNWTANVSNTYNLASASAQYSYFRLICTCTQPANDNGTFAIAELEYTMA